MAFEKNIGILREAVGNHAFITPINEHKNPDGSFNAEQFLIKWKTQMQKFDRIRLWEYLPDFETDKDPLQEEPYIVFIPAEGANRSKTTILISHGGGFQIRTGCEGPNAALYFHELGYNTAVLTYRLMPVYNRQDCLDDIQRAIRVLRERQEELQTDGTVVVMGFSAGAMLSANAATLFVEGNPQAEDRAERLSSRPDAAVSCYGGFTDVSFPIPFGIPEDDNKVQGRDFKEKYRMAPEKHVTPETPPFFIWQTLSDDGRYGMNLAKALQDAHVPYELHIFEGGTHGIGLADGENDLHIDSPHIAHWAVLCDEWLQFHGLK